MGKKTENLKASNAGEMVINLFGPGMTALHKAGLAGLWMTLKTLEKNNVQLNSGSWALTNTSVTLKWSGDPKTFFSSLFNESFKIDKNGLFHFPALGDPLNHSQHAVTLQEAILGTFLQHGLTRKSDPSQGPSGNLSIQRDNSTEIINYHKVNSYAHQKADNFKSDGENSIVGWLYPGGVVRHTGHSNTALEEPPERALALRFAPIGAIYFEVRARGGGVRPRYAIVLPEITDLGQYKLARETFLNYGTEKMFAAGSTDAAFRVLAELQANNLLQNISSTLCRVFSFGIIPWSKQQKTRVEVITVRADSQDVLKTYRLCQQFFRAEYRANKKYWDVPQMPELVAANLCAGKKWWEGFSDFVADVDRRKHVLYQEKGGLANMVENLQALPNGAERTFVMACHEAWRRRMGKLGEKARREGSSFEAQVGREFEKLRVSLSRCKNASALRETVTDFWARAGGGIKDLQEGWRDILPLLEERNWKKTRDLALLALASYKPQSKEEQDAFEKSESEEEEVS